MAHHTHIWLNNPHLEAKAKRLWLDGMTTTKIGEALGVSKNAICSLRKCRNWPQRGNPIRPLSYTHTPEPPPVMGRRPTLPALESLRDMAAWTSSPVPPAAPHKCRWTDSDNKPFVWCDQPVWPGTSWCPRHHDRVFQVR